MKRLIKLLVFSLLFILMLAPASYGYALPLAETYWFTNLGIGGASNINSYLDNMGYNGNIYCNSGAYYVRRTMDDDAVFAYVGHGYRTGGILLCTDSASYISAYNIVGDYDNYSLQYAFAGTTNKLKNIRLAYYGACWSDKYSPTYGQLTTYTTNTLGALSSIGFSDEVFDPVVSYFETKVFLYLDLGQTVSTAVGNAIIATKSYYGQELWNQSQVGSLQVRGNGDTRLEPAAYGN